MRIDEKIRFIGAHDGPSAERLKRLLDREAAMKDRTVYGEAFTDRQFSLVFEPLLEAALGRARILEFLACAEGTVRSLAGALAMSPERVFRHMKELMRRNLVEICRFEERHAVFRRKPGKGAGDDRGT